jgi:hypothetical protein
MIFGDVAVKTDEFVYQKYKMDSYVYIGRHRISWCKLRSVTRIGLRKGAIQ